LPQKIHFLIALRVADLDELAVHQALAGEGVQLAELGVLCRSQILQLLAFSLKSN